MATTTVLVAVEEKECRRMSASEVRQSEWVYTVVSQRAK
jgi:hypothetical protein